MYTCVDRQIYTRKNLIGFLLLLFVGKNSFNSIQHSFLIKKNKFHRIRNKRITTIFFKLSLKRFKIIFN